MSSWFFPLENFRENGTSEKVVPFSKFSDGTACSIYGIGKGFYQFQAAHDHIFGEERWRPLTSNLSYTKGSPTERTYIYPLAMNHTNLIKGNWRSSKLVLLRNSSRGLYFSAQSFKGPSSVPEVAFHRSYMQSKYFH